MVFHKIKNVAALPDCRLSVQFSEGVTKIYDIKPLFDRLPIFAALKDDVQTFYNVSVDIGGYGIVITKAEIKALDLPDDNKDAVYQRMISERENIAASYTAEGAAKAQKIRNETDKEVSIRKAEAEKQAAELSGEGEAKYMEILADAYNTEEKASFYNYIRSVEAMKKSLSGSGDKTIILDKDSELARILYGDIR